MYEGTAKPASGPAPMLGLMRADLLREAGCRDILDALPAAIYATDPRGRIIYYNRAAAELAGREPRLGVDHWCVTWRLYHPDGRFLAHDECPMAVALKENRAVRGAEAIAERPDGSRFSFTPYPTPLHDSRGRLIGAVNMLVDISAHKRMEERLQLALAELTHRVKNTLSTVQALALHSFREAGVGGKARAIFEERLLALSKTHDQLTRQLWDSADLAEMIPALLAPYGGAGDRISLAGPAARLNPDAAVTMGMIIHELATNAAKYGALAEPQGRLAVSWRLHADGESQRLALEWREQSGHAVAAPTREGFGSKLMRRAVAGQLRGTLEQRYEADGLLCRIEIPLAPG